MRDRSPGIKVRNLQMIEISLVAPQVQKPMSHDLFARYVKERSVRQYMTNEFHQIVAETIKSSVYSCCYFNLAL